MYWAEVRHEAFTSNLPTRIPTSEEAALGAGQLTATLTPRPRLRFRIAGGTDLAPAQLHIGVTSIVEGRLRELTVSHDQGLVDVFVSDKAMYEVRAWAEGFHVAKLPVLASVADAPVPELKLEKAGSLPLQIVDANGATIPDATCLFSMSPRGQESLFEWTSSRAIQAREGDLTLPVISGEDWPTLRVDAPGFQSRAVTYLKWPTPNSEGDVVIQLVRSATLRVTVLGKSGAPIPAANVYITIDGKAETGSTATDDAGQITRADLAEATISVMARGPNGQLTERQEIRLTVGAITDVTLTLR